MNTNHLEKVRAELVLATAESRLSSISRDTGISLDTLYRIRDGKADPAYSKVQALADYFWPPKKVRAPKLVTDISHA